MSRKKHVVKLKEYWIAHGDDYCAFLDTLDGKKWG